jgi:hypothetical protein
MPGNLAIVQPQRDDEAGPSTIFKRPVQNESQLALDISVFNDGVPGNANDDTIRICDCVFNFIIPIHTGEQFLIVQPRVDPFLLRKAMINFVDKWFILRCTTKKNS